VAPCLPPPPLQAVEVVPDPNGSACSTALLARRDLWPASRRIDLGGRDDQPARKSRSNTVVDYGRAAGLAAEIEARFEIEPTLIKGMGGIFDVRLDGALLYSKKASALPRAGRGRTAAHIRLSA
jgi:hypothetical protein